LLPKIKHLVQIYHLLLDLDHFGFIFRGWSLAAYEHFADILVNNGLEMVLTENGDDVARVDGTWVLLDNPLHHFLVDSTKIISLVYTF
jgi:hypothetical protein